MVSSMGTATKADKSNEGMGGILYYKRVSEEYLVQSGIDYTIIHPGGLSNEPEGQREFIIGKNDSIYETGPLMVTRGDVAEVVVQSLLNENAINKSFDVTSSKETQDSVKTDFQKIFDKTSSF